MAARPVSQHPASFVPTKTRRLLLDSNVVVSALLWGGRPRQLLNLALTGQVVLVSSAALLAELRHTLGYAKLTTRLSLIKTSVDTLMQQYQEIVTLVQPAQVPRVVPEDPDDDQVVAAALAGDAELIVSGDRHLLKLHSHAGIAIVSVSEALERLAQQHHQQP